MKGIVRILTVIGAVISGFTVLDAVSFVVTGTSLADNFFGSGSPISDLILEKVPGMTLVEFLSVNVAAIIFCSVVMVACIHYSLFSGKKVRK